MKITRKDAAITNTDEEFPGSFRVVLSAPLEDRDGDTLLPDEWKTPLPDHITFDTDHGMSVATTVGSGHPYLSTEAFLDPEGKEVPVGSVIVDGTYSSLPRAQEARTLVGERHIRTTSVAYMTVPNMTKGAKKGAKLRELLNGAFVAIPSLREAAVLSSKDANNKAGARNSAADATKIQTIHDHASALGADCASVSDTSKSTSNVKLKAVAGSLEATQERVRDALQDAYPSFWIFLRATIPSGDGGTLVFDLENTDTYDSESFKQDYTDDGSVITLIGERSAVDLMEVIKPDPDDAADSAGTGSAAAASKTAAAKSTPAEDAESAEMQVRSARMRFYSTLHR